MKSKWMITALVAVLAMAVAVPAALADRGPGPDGAEAVGSEESSEDGEGRQNRGDRGRHRGKGRHRGHGRKHRRAFKRAKRACRAELSEIGTDAFVAKYADEDARNAERSAKRECVHTQLEQLREAHKAARQACRAEAEEIGREAFIAKYAPDAERRAGKRARKACVRAHLDESAPEEDGDEEQPPYDETE